MLAYGRIALVESAEERLVWIHRFRDFFNQRLDWLMPSTDTISTARSCGILLLTIDQLTARAEHGHDKKAHLATDKPR